MDTTVVPDAASFVLKIDGVPRAIDSFTWPTADTLKLLSGPGAQPLVDVTVELTDADPNLRAPFHKVVQPFGPEVITEQ